MLRPVENLSSECAGAFQHGGGTADTVAFVSPTVPHAYSICNGPERRRAFQPVTEGNAQVDVGGAAEGLDRVEVAAQ